MTTSDIRHFLLWCAGLNYAILLIWFGAFVFAHDWMYRLHGRWFKLPVGTFDAMHLRGCRSTRSAFSCLTWRR